MAAFEHLNNQIIDTGDEEILLLFNEEDLFVNSQQTISGKENDDLSTSTWTDEATKLLIDIYSKNKILVESGKIKTLKRMWEIIKDVMVSHKYNFTAIQIENRWKTLERSFKNHMENKKKTGRSRKFLPYEK